MATAGGFFTGIGNFFAGTGGVATGAEAGAATSSAFGVTSTAGAGLTNVAAPTAIGTTATGGGITAAQASAIASGVAATGSAVQSNRAAEAQNDQINRAASIERAQARIDNNRRARLAIKATRIQTGQIEATTQNENTGSNSAVTGAIGSLRTQTASNIGAANTQLSAQLGISAALQQGRSDFVKHSGRASTLAGLATTFDTLSQSPQALKKLRKLVGFS